jgi:predicted transcriptional regulator YdeE
MNVQDDLQHQKNEENIQKVWKVIHSNHHLTSHELEEKAGISKSTYHEIPTENLGMQYVAAISVHSC